MKNIVMVLTAYKKLFGIGPLGALITLALFSLVWLVEWKIGRFIIMIRPFPLRCAGIFLIVFGLFLHMWTFFTLKNWWRNDQLCTRGPFRYFRHPMYAAWVTFISMGVALMFNSWMYVLWALLLHPIWHVLARREEKIVMNVFGDEYRRYAARTGRFVPRFRAYSVTP
jgi:protein-S-isoprenylcysteine O-methyltransferase Ste14